MTTTQTHFESENEARDDDGDELILDMRSQSYIKLYVVDILNAEVVETPATSVNSNNNNNNNSGSKPALVKVAETVFCTKVALAGLVVGIYEAEKFYRVKLDDSTGCINITLWRNLIYDDDSLLNNNKFMLKDAANSEHAELYSLLGSIRARTREPAINARIMYEPRQGDLIAIRATLKHFQQRIELNVVSCVRVQTANEELLHTILPAMLHERVYSRQLTTLAMYNERVRRASTAAVASGADETNASKKSAHGANSHQAFLSLVLKSLLKLSSNLLDNTGSRACESKDRESVSASESCHSYSIFSYIRNNCSLEQRNNCTHKQVIDALKELEINGQVYSCDNEYQYLPMVDNDHFVQ